jgi:hypothetical protein
LLPQSRLKESALQLKKLLLRPKDNVSMKKSVLKQSANSLPNTRPDSKLSALRRRLLKLKDKLSLMPKEKHAMVDQ